MPRGPGSSFMSQVAVTTGRTARIRGQAAENGAWVEFCSDDDDGFLSGGVALNCAHPYSRVCRDTPLSLTRKAMPTDHRIMGFSSSTDARWLFVLGAEARPPDVRVITFENEGIGGLRKYFTTTEISQRTTETISTAFTEDSGA